MISDLDGVSCPGICSEVGNPTHVFDLDGVTPSWFSNQIPGWRYRAQVENQRSITLEGIIPEWGFPALGQIPG